MLSLRFASFHSKAMKPGSKISNIPVMSPAAHKCIYKCMSFQVIHRRTPCASFFEATGWHRMKDWLSNRTYQEQIHMRFPKSFLDDLKARIRVLEQIDSETVRERVWQY